MTQYNEFPNIMNRITNLTRRVRDQETAPRLYSVGIGKGGIRVYEGGSVNVRDGGDINVLAGGEVTVGSSGSINVLSGGQIISEGAANFTGATTITGNTTISGNLSIQGTVTFPDGKLDGTFLKNQFSSTNVSGSSSSFSGNFSGDKKVISKSVSVPSWATDMYVMATGVVYIDDTDPAEASAMKLFIDTQESWGGILQMYATGGRFPASGGMNLIRRVDVTNKSSVSMGTIAYVSGGKSGSEGSASFDASVIFVR